MKPEKEVKAEIRKYLDSIGVFHWNHWNNRVGKFGNKKGISDILGVLQGGRFLAIEVKKEGWNPPKKLGSKEHDHYLNQLIFINKIRQNGGCAFFAQSVEDVIKKLEIL